MTIFHAFNVGVSGIQSQGHRLQVISQNIANVDTTGYKNMRSEFANLVGSALVNTIDTGGARANDSQTNTKQGEIIGTTQVTDIAIAGPGFFAVGQNVLANSSLMFTRAGTFTPDNAGNLRNGAGFYLQGWRLSTTGTVPSMTPSALETVNVEALDEQAVPTSTMEMHLNLYSAQGIYNGTPVYNAGDITANMSGGVIQPHFSQPLTVIDSEGEDHTIYASFLKTAINTWSVELRAQDATQLSSGLTQIANGTLVFNGDGSLSSVSSSITQPGTISWTGGTANTIAIDWGTAGPIFGTPGATTVGRVDGVTQLDKTYELGTISQNGIRPGTLKGITISEDGYVVANYDNGSTNRLFLIPLVKFVNPDQLEALSGTVYVQSELNGDPTYVQPGEDGAGVLRGSSLERSTADEAEELTNMIITQRSYQMNSSVISRTDSMLQTLTQMI